MTLHLKTNYDVTVAAVPQTHHYEVDGAERQVDSEVGDSRCDWLEIEEALNQHVLVLDQRSVGGHLLDFAVMVVVGVDMLVAVVLGSAGKVKMAGIDRLAVVVDLAAERRKEDALAERVEVERDLIHGDVCLEAVV